MKKLLTARYLSLFMLLSLLGGKAEARHYDDDVYYENRDCCPSSCYECSCNPLYCGAWDLQIQVGVNPIVWHKRDPILAVTCLTPISATPLVTLYDELPKFKDFFKTPWVVGGQVGYHWSDNTRLYLEFNYSQARGKDDVAVPTNPIGGAALPVVFNWDKYRLFDAHVGARYYWDRWCDRVAFFLGGKVGLTHHKSSEVSLLLGTTAVAFPDIEIFESNTGVSGGANFGLDICFCGNWSLVITGEVVASCGPHSVAVVPLPAALIVPPLPANAFTDLLPGGVHSELHFPITVAVRYSF